MSHLLATVIPLALGAAVSPILFGIEMLALTSSHSPKVRAWLVAAGSLAILLVFSVAGLLLSTSLPHHRPHPHVDGAIDLLVAGLLAWLALRTWRRRALTPPPGKKTLLERLDGAPTRTFFVAGAVGMVTNFSSLVLYLPAFRAISKSSVSPQDKALCLAIVLVITLMVVWIPAAIVTVAGSRAQPALQRMNGFMTRQSTTITIAICVAFAAYLTIKALTELI